MIAVLGSLDTKGAEFHYLVEAIHNRGHTTLVIDTSVLSEPPWKPEVSAAQVAEAGGADLARLRQQADRGQAMEIMALGAARLAHEFYTAGRIDGLIGMGGSGASSIFAAVVRALPIGFPKLLITTLASGDTRGIVGSKDPVLVPAVVDIAGLNRISRQTIAQAAGAICGMVETRQTLEEGDRPIIAASMLGNTTQAVDIARQVFEEAGYEVLVFHTIGQGGRTMESLIADGWISSVFDITTNELASELVGAPTSAGSDRLQAAGKAGLPMVIAPGCMDMSIFWSADTLPDRYRERLTHAWNPQTTLMRTTPEESAELGKQIAAAANTARGPVAVLLPLKGLSLLDVEGGPFWLPETDEALFAAIRTHLEPGVPLIELDLTINEPAFARRAAETLLELIAARIGQRKDAA